MSKEEIRKEIEAILHYEIAEGIVYRDETGKLKHSTPESFGIDENIFIGLEDVLE